MIKLAEKPEGIEHIYEIRDWMETIPMVVRQQDELTRRYVLEYEVLDFFWYALPQEDFELKWEAIGWPFRVTKQVEATNAFLDEEVQKFLKIHIDDEFALQEKIETLTVQVTQMSGLRDAAKVTYIFAVQQNTMVCLLY